MELDTKEISLKKELYEIISVQGKTW
jgi:hypothetical protein